MNRPPRRKPASPQVTSRIQDARMSKKRPYTRPQIEPAGSVFSRTKALGIGTKEGLVGSSLL